jgi:hypothetical protein
MANFQKIIVFCAVIVLFVLFLFVGYAFYTSKSAVVWPPISAQCPDYWKIDSSGKCINVKNLGSCSDKTMDFNSAIFTGANGNCQKYNWAKKCGVSWDGITYGINNPCLQM